MIHWRYDMARDYYELWVTRGRATHNFITIAAAYYSDKTQREAYARLLSVWPDLYHEIVRVPRPGVPGDYYLDFPK